LAGTILIGSVPGVWLGSHMSVRLPAGTLRTILGVVLIGAAMGLGSNAGLPIPPWAIAVVPGILAVIVLWERFRNRVHRHEADTVAQYPGTERRTSNGGSWGKGERRKEREKGVRRREQCRMNDPPAPSRRNKTLAHFDRIYYRRCRFTGSRVPRSAAAGLFAGETMDATLLLAFPCR
jgi:hypothetical protein